MLVNEFYKKGEKPTTKFRDFFHEFYNRNQHESYSRHNVALPVSVCDVNASRNRPAVITIRSVAAQHVRKRLQLV